jgi:peptide/nickel transport system substrate-binding protein
MKRISIPFLLLLLSTAAATADNYMESPMLTARVSSGELPPVEDRLPDQPVVFDASWNDVPTEDLDFQVGKYGGTLRAVRTHPNWDADVWAMLKETLVASPGWMDANPKDLRGNVILDYEISEDGTTFTFTMREGLKWSDGVAVTTEDVRFTYEDVHMNDELQEFGWDIMQQWMRTGNQPDGEPMLVEVIDDYTFQVSFPEPYPGFINSLAVFWGTYRDFLKPKHHLMNFHPEYTSSDKLKDALAEAGLEDDEWYKLFLQEDHNTWEKTNTTAVDFPSLCPWIISNVTPTVTLWERNPYYFKVDSEGQQLPYIDMVRSEYVTDRETINLKIVAGELDIVEREAGGPNLPFFKENEERGGYNVTLLQQHFAPVDIYLNMTHADPVWRGLAQDLRFRQALNMAIDRQDIIGKVFYGFASLPEVVPSAYDPARANQLLDEIGLTARDADGNRLGPDGNPLMIPIEWAPESPDFQPVVELLTRDWTELDLDVIPRELQQDLLHERERSNEIKISLNWDDLEKWWLFATIWGSPRFATHSWHLWYTSGGESGEQGPDWVYEFFDRIAEVRSSSYEDAQRLVKGAQQIMYDNILYIPTVQKLRKPLLTSARLGNVPTSGMVLVGVNSGEQLYFRE